MIIDLNVKEWQPNYLAFKDAGNVPAALTTMSTTVDQNAALGRRYWNPLGECFVYVLCDCSRGLAPVADAWSIAIAAGSRCYVEEVGTTGTSPNLIYNVYESDGSTNARKNAIAIYAISSTKAAGVTSPVVKAWGLVKFAASGIYQAT